MVTRAAVGITAIIMSMLIALSTISASTLSLDTAWATCTEPTTTNLGPTTDPSATSNTNTTPGATSTSTAAVTTPAGPTRVPAGPGTPTGRVCDGGDGLTQPVANTTLPAGFTLPPGTPVPVRVAVAWALAQQGTPYTYGGDCTNPHAGVPAHQCDCSSLMQQAYAHAAITLPRTTYQQIHAGTPITNLTDAQPGDLLFIPGSDGTAARPGHVGMYIGNDLLIQAPHTGDTVKISTVSTWANQIVAIRRPTP